MNRSLHLFLVCPVSFRHYRDLPQIYKETNKGLNTKKEDLFGNTYINMKRYYTGLVFILSWLFILLLAIGGFIFECIYFEGLGNF